MPEEEEESTDAAGIVEEKVVATQELDTLRATQAACQQQLDAVLAAKARMTAKTDDWQDPVLLAEIKAATGVDLDLRNARRRGRGSSGLTDIRKTSTRERLSKKMKRLKKLT